eukprot:5125436-Alexandrium_andersonii.AAC.1
MCIRDRLDHRTRGVPANNGQREPRGRAALARAATQKRATAQARQGPSTPAPATAARDRRKPLA